MFRYKVNHSYNLCQSAQNFWNVGEWVNSSVTSEIFKRIGILACSLTI